MLGKIPFTILVFKMKTTLFEVFIRSISGAFACLAACFLLMYTVVQREGPGRVCLGCMDRPGLFGSTPGAESTDGLREGWKVFAT